MQLYYYNSKVFSHTLNEKLSTPPTSAVSEAVPRIIKMKPQDKLLGDVVVEHFRPLHDPRARLETL